MSITLEKFSCFGPGGKEPEHEMGSLPRDCDQCLDYLNSCRLLVETSKLWDTDKKTWILDRENNRSQGSMMSNRHIEFISKVHELSLEHLFMYVKRFEGIAATFSIMYHTRIVKERVPDVKSAESAKEFSEAIAAQKYSQRPKKEKKALDERGKAIAALVAVGIPESVAIASVDSKLKEQGKVTQ